MARAGEGTGGLCAGPRRSARAHEARSDRHTRSPAGLAHRGGTSRRGMLLPALHVCSVRWIQDRSAHHALNSRAKGHFTPRRAEPRKRPLRSRPSKAQGKVLHAAEQEAGSPLEGFAREAQGREAAQQSRHGELCLGPCEVRAETEMDAVTEGQMLARLLATHVESVGVGEHCGIAVCGSEQKDDLFPPWNSTTSHLDVFG